MVLIRSKTLLTSIMLTNEFPPICNYRTCDRESSVALSYLTSYAPKRAEPILSCSRCLAVGTNRSRTGLLARSLLANSVYRLK